MEDEAPKTKDLSAVHKRAMSRFEAAVIPQMEIREHAIQCRRFVSVPGAMWEGPWGEQFENTPRPEIDKISKGLDKLIRDYRENRIVPDFRPAKGKGSQETADTLDAMHRADSHRSGAQEARDIAVEEAFAGGFGAYRLKNELEDEYDKENDAQRINPAFPIVDADQRVFFDPNSKRYDKKDARYAFVLTAVARECFEEDHPEAAVSWPEGVRRINWDMFTPDMVLKCEYYERQERDVDLIILSHGISGDEQRHWAEEFDEDELAEAKVLGWTAKTVKRKRCRVRKFTMTGAEVLSDDGFIAGRSIPIVPIYFRRWYVDNVERFRGYVSKKMDPQRLYNSKVAKLAETDSLAPREVPIFDPDQVPGDIGQMWANQNIERFPYLLAKALRNEDGSIAHMGPVGTVSPPTLPPVTSALLQIASGDLSEDDQEPDEVRANTSADAMDIAATRVDARSSVPLDNVKKSTQREGEIYLEMAEDVYFEEGREVETMSEDGDDGTAILKQPMTDDSGRFMIANDFNAGAYKVIADVTEDTATRRDKTVRAAINIADIALKAADTEMAQACIITAVYNSDGEGIDDLRRFARNRGLSIGLFEPNEEEAEQAEQAAQNAQPDPTVMLAEAQGKALQASAAKDMATVEKIGSEVSLNEAKRVETIAKATGHVIPMNRAAGM
jgi:hypothetical protein